MTCWTRHVTLSGVIPDIAFMIMLCGVAVLLIVAIYPYRQGSGTGAQIANAFTWVIVVGAIVGLVILGADVASSASSLTDLGR